MFTILPAENEVALFKISRSIQTSESDFVSLSESPPAKTVFHETNWNFYFHLSSVTHLLMSLLPFRRMSGFPLLGYFQELEKDLKFRSETKSGLLSSAIPPRSHFVERNEMNPTHIVTARFLAKHFKCNLFYFISLPFLTKIS
jgi:hypothetical protein